MKTKTNSMISLVLCILMVATMMLSSVVAFSVNAKAATDPTTIEKVIVDHRSADALQKTGGKIYVQDTILDESDLYIGGKTSFDEAMKALKIDYYPDNTKANRPYPHRFLSYVNGTKALTKEYKYFVVVYAANTTKNFEMSLWNTPGQGAQAFITKNGQDTQGKFVVSDPIDISTPDAAGLSNLSRWERGSLNSLFIKCDDTAATFYIKEYGFFKSAEDAKAYYAAVDLEKDPTTYMSGYEKSLLLKKTFTNSGPGLTPITYRDYIYEEAQDAAENQETFEGELPAPVIMKFTSFADMSDSGVSQANLSGNLEGTYTFDKTVGAIKLTYSIPDSGKMPNYRMMPMFNSNKPTADHKYVRITYMTPDPIPSTINIINNAIPSLPITLVGDTSVSRGQWITSNAVDISENDALTRFMSGKQCTFGYTSNTDSSVIYIKEIAFFVTKKQAYDYYGDEETFESSGMSSMTFGSDGTGTTRDDTNTGNYVLNEKEKTVDIYYAEKTGHKVNYMVQLKFLTGDIEKSHKYVRVLYSAKNPEGVNENVSMYLHNNRDNNDIILLQKNLKDTGGEFVLSDTSLISYDMMERFKSEGLHNSININTTLPGGEYRIKALYFFGDKQSADAFALSAGDSTISVLGNDISKYQIVIPEGEPLQLKTAANTLVTHIETISSVKLPIVTDDAPATDYEIILGLGNRSESKELYASMANKSPYNYEAKVMGNKLVVVSESHIAVSQCVDLIAESFLYKGKTTVPKTLTIDNHFSHGSTCNYLVDYNDWAPYENVADPDVFTDDFDADDGYWLEDANGSEWNIVNGKLSVSADKPTISFLQVFEPNATISAKLAYSNAGADGKMALMLRSPAADSYLTAGYDFGTGEWYIDCRESNDFANLRLASAKATITPNTEYLLSFTATKNNVSLSVDGKQILTLNNVSHVTPGRIGFYAKDVTFTADDAEVVLLSGQGVIIRNVTHNVLPDNTFREGGTVVELTDGTLIYQHKTISFKSVDSGKTWERLDSLYFNTDGLYAQILRLNNGDLLQIRVINGDRYATISKDDGKTWTQGGFICTSKYQDSKSKGTNMNDKVTQMSDGRIIYVQSYSGGEGGAFGDTIMCFDIVFYSDDNGMTWKESETATCEMKGNEDRLVFAESKVIECADGTLRLYNSYNNYGCIVYSESKDNGVTWGPIVTMPEFICSRSSMQLVRDPYAENDTTYYMVWGNSVPWPDSTGKGKTMSRSALSLAKTTDGKNWEYLGDVWHWEFNYLRRTANALPAHYVDPFIQCTKDALFVGSGVAERLPVLGDKSDDYHGAQRQHIWRISRETLGEIAIPVNKFTDVAFGAPYYSAVTYVNDAGLFQGTSATTFAPDIEMTRSMFVTVLGRLDGSDMAQYTTPSFKDVVAGQWYTSYVEWAAANGVVNGIGNGLYGINDSVTIEQALTILGRYNGFKQSNPTGKTVADFADSADVSSWALEGMKWAVENGIYDGQLGKLNPKATASRAVVATMFYNYSIVFGK